MSKITAAIPGDDYLLTICLDNNHSITLDIKNKLHTIRFSELRDKQVFNAAKTDGKQVYWPSGLSIAVNEIMEIVAT